ncbi:unnamed protein product [Protopolystoma xenopodis]|uniref:Uncharacterized protein n=1 Tax=Protopolystoma xenopodis TaxID=117903 RepID=A0A3S5B2F2_9PLAT|nr:unnamed protein product [Protopolystoma xenopodis]
MRREAQVARLLTGPIAELSETSLLLGEAADRLHQSRLEPIGFAQTEGQQARAAVAPTAQDQAELAGVEAESARKQTDMLMSRRSGPSNGSTCSRQRCIARLGYGQHDFRAGSHFN